MSVLVRNYKFELRDGPETKIGTMTTLTPRAKIEGESGWAVPMRVRRIEY